MATFLALTSRGLVDVLVRELESLNFKNVKKVAGGAEFESNWAGCYRANLQLRAATRVILPILDFPAYQNDDLYNNTLKHDFTKYILPTQTLMVDASVRDSSFHDNRFVAMKIKDAIVDQFREKFDVRPDVDTENPHLCVMARVVRNQVSLAVDTTGISLGYRGYRRDGGEAPLREHLAAGLLYLSGWDRSVPIVDLMCGSGTILIEAALMARNIAPGTMRPGFAFQKLQGFQPEAWDSELEAAIGQEQETNLKFYGFDINFKALQAAKQNAQRAGVDDLIELHKKAVDMHEGAPVEKGVIIVNPPYGERIGIPEELKDVYRDLAFILKRYFKGWTCWILSGTDELTQHLKLKSSQKISVYNGPIECRFLRYEIR